MGSICWSSPQSSEILNYWLSFRRFVSKCEDLICLLWNTELLSARDPLGFPDRLWCNEGADDTHIMLERPSNSEEAVELQLCLVSPCEQLIWMQEIGGFIIFNILDKVLPDLPWSLAWGLLLEVGPWAARRHEKAAHHWHREIPRACTDP